MNWEAVGAIGEVVGAAGVIFTIGFLAFQIRQNSVLLRNNTRQLEQSHKVAIAQALSKSDSQSDPMLIVAQSNELSDIVVRGLANYKDLGREDAMRFSMAMGPIVAAASTTIGEQRQLGIVDNDVVPAQLNFLMRFIDKVGGRQWWKQGKNMYPDTFIATIDAEILARDDAKRNA